MYGVIMATHGNFATGLYSGFKLICGELSNVKAVDFIEGDSVEVLDEKIVKAYEELKDCDKILVLADLAGGTPFTRAVMLFGEKENVRVLSGLSFPLLYMATLVNNENIDEAVEFILNEAKSATMVYKLEARVEEEPTDGV